MDANGDAEGNYTVLAMLPDDEYKMSENKLQLRSMSMRPIGNFIYPSRTDASITGRIPSFKYFNENVGIRWVGGGPPKAEPHCGFKGEYCVYKPDWRTIIVCVVFSFVLAIASVLVTR